MIRSYLEGYASDFDYINPLVNVSTNKKTKNELYRSNKKTKNELYRSNKKTKNELYRSNKKTKNELYRSNKKEIKRVIFNEPYTIVIWANGEKTIVKAQDGEPYDKEKGLAMCFAKYALGNTCRYFDFFKEVCDEAD